MLPVLRRPIREITGISNSLPVARASRPCVAGPSRPCPDQCTTAQSRLAVVKRIRRRILNWYTVKPIMAEPMTHAIAVA